MSTNGTRPPAETPEAATVREDGTISQAPEMTRADSGTPAETTVRSGGGTPEKRAGRSRRKKEPKWRRFFTSPWRRRLTWKERLILITPVIAAVAAVVIINRFFTEEVMSYELKGGPCQYYGGNVYPIKEGAVLTRTPEGTTVITDDGGERTANDLPVYYLDKDEMTTTQDMIYYAPRSGFHGRLEHFTEAHLSSGGRVSLERDGQRLSLESGFIYNGEDLYIFLEPVILTFNGYKMNLPPLSYVEAVYTGDVMVFNYGTKEFLVEPPMGAVTASIETGDYEVSLINDSMTNYAGKRTLLFSRPELLEPVG